MGPPRTDEDRRVADRSDRVEPLVQANAKRGFQITVVQITAFEYEAALAISRTSLEA